MFSTEIGNYVDWKILGSKSYISDKSSYNEEKYPIFDLSTCSLDEKPEKFDQMESSKVINFDNLEGNELLMNSYLPATVEEYKEEENNQLGNDAFVVQVLDDNQIGDIEVEEINSKTEMEPVTPIQKIRSVIKMIFTEKVTALPVEPLSKLDLDVLECLLNKKLKGKEKDLVTGIIQLIKANDADGLNELLYKRFESVKRNDEQRKFIFKNVLKALKEKFKLQENLIKGKKTEEKFWEHYFGEYSKEHKLSMDVFYDPLNGSFKKNQRFANLKKDYFAIILNEATFYAAFMEQLEALELHYMAKIDHKIKLMIPNSDTIEWTEKGVKKFIRKMGNSKAVKFPWSLTEIRKTVEDFKGRIAFYKKEGALEKAIKNISK